MLLNNPFLNLKTFLGSDRNKTFVFTNTGHSNLCLEKLQGSVVGKYLEVNSGGTLQVFSRFLLLLP